MPHLPAFRLYLITDRKLAARHGGLLPVVEAALAAASTVAPRRSVAIQLREKDLSARELYDLARALRELCSRYDSALIVNDRLDVALAVAADGIHLPADSFAIADARRLIGPAGLIGVSTHTPWEVSSAAAAGADFAVFGPVYPPLSKAVHVSTSGIAGLAAACRAGAAMPVYALGGITPDRTRELAQSAELVGASRPYGVAAIGTVFDAIDPSLATCQLLTALVRWESQFLP